MSNHSDSKDQEEMKNEKRPHNDNPSPLALSVAFPQATPASIFPPCTSDYYQFDDLLTPEERTLRLKVREFMETEIAPIMTKFWEKAEFPFHVLPKIAALGIVGTTVKGYGCPGLSITAAAIAAAEMARVDASSCLFVTAHSSAAMVTIYTGGSEAQKEKYLPSMAQLKTISCWGLSEPGHGSDASSLDTTATKVDGGWILEGQKRWIGNCTIADLLVILAKNTTTNQINVFLVQKDAPGLQITKIENKIGMRIVQNGDVLLNNVFVPDDDKLPQIKSFQDINELFLSARLVVLWSIIGVAQGVYDMCYRYMKERKQFGVPLAAFQLTQMKLVQMLGNIQAMFLFGWRLCKLHENKRMTIGQVCLGKAWVSLKARETVSIGRELLGGNGILTDFLVAKAFCDLEAFYTFEGTYEVCSLVTGREITGISSFKPAISTQKSRL